jgi:hypothetical protein
MIARSFAGRKERAIMRKLPHQKLVAYEVAMKLLESVRAAGIRDAHLRDQAMRAAKSACSLYHTKLSESLKNHLDRAWPAATVRGMQQTTTTRSTADVAALAARADVALPTVIRYLAGMPIRGPQRRRIEAAIAADRRDSTPPPRRSRRAA